MSVVTDAERESWRYLKGIDPDGHLLPGVRDRIRAAFERGYLDGVQLRESALHDPRGTP